jgi:hypothetical protein
MSTRRVLLFDVNETLLDMAALDVHFERLFGDVRVRREWFATMLGSALLFTVTGPYVEFGAHFRIALRLVAERYGKTLSSEDESACWAAFVRCPRIPMYVRRSSSSARLVSAWQRSRTRCPRSKRRSSRTRGSVTSSRRPCPPTRPSA